MIAIAEHSSPRAKIAGMLARVALAMLIALVLCPRPAMAMTGSVTIHDRPSPADAAPSQPHLKPGVCDFRDISPCLYRVIDPERKFTFTDVESRPLSAFSRVDAALSPGYTDDAVWYRADIHMPSPIAPFSNFGLPESRYLKISPAFLNEIQVRIFDLQDHRRIWNARLGDHELPDDYSTRVGALATRLPSLDAGNYRLVFRVTSNSTQLFSAKIAGFAGITSDSMISLFFCWFLISALCGAGLVYLGAGILVQDAAIRWYSGYLFTLAALLSGFSGAGLLFMPQSWTLANDVLIGGSSALAITTSLMMWIEVLDLKSLSRLVDRVFRVYAYLNMLVILITPTRFYTYFGETGGSIQVLILMAALMCIAIQLYRNPHQPMLQFYCLALSFPSVAASVHLLSLTGWIPRNTITAYAYPVATIFHIALMSIAMGYRTSKIKRKRHAALLHRNRTRLQAEEQRDFITMLAHEFRTPLAIIQRAAEMLALHLKSSGDGISDRLTRIMTHAAHLSRLVDVFLTKETLDRAAFSVTKRPLRLLDFLTELTTISRRERPEMNIILAGTPDTVIDADPTLFNLAVGNVIENAWKYAPNSPITLDCDHDAHGYASIRVADQGPGMNQDELSMVSQAFFRGKSATQTSGVGLGLHITSRIIEAHDGQVTVSVGENGGTTVLFKLPLNRPATIDRVRARHRARQIAHDIAANTSRGGGEA